jgi:hypothetical protein
MSQYSLLMELQQDKSRTEDAVIIAKNLFSRHPSSKRYFKVYFELLCKIVSENKVLSDRLYYAREAEMALSYFKENARIDKNVLTYINSCSHVLQEIAKSLEEDDQEEAVEESEDSGSEDEKPLDSTEVMEEIAQHSFLIELKQDPSRYEDAIIVAKNMYSRHPSSKMYFELYFEIMCKMYFKQIGNIARRNYVAEMEFTLNYFKENVGIDSDILSFINSCSLLIQDFEKSLEDDETKKSAEELIATSTKNEKMLDELADLKVKLGECKSKVEYDGLLKEVMVCENALKKDSLSIQQQARYESFTPEYSALISKKMRMFERESQIDVNKKAAASYKSAFDNFRKEESKYKKDRKKLKDLVTTKLFIQDPTSLFPETQAYYGHVYSFIFSKLDDDGKYELTKMQIEFDRKSSEP